MRRADHNVYGLDPTAGKLSHEIPAAKLERFEPAAIVITGEDGRRTFGLHLEESEAVALVSFILEATPTTPHIPAQTREIVGGIAGQLSRAIGETS